MPTADRVIDRMGHDTTLRHSGQAQREPESTELSTADFLIAD